MSTTSRARRRAPLGLLAAAALLALPGTAFAAADFSISMPRPDPRLGELVLRARCDPACTVRLDELSVIRFRTRGGVAQLPHPARGALSGTRRIAAGRTVSIRLPVPPAVQRAARAALPSGEALVGNVAMTVDQGAGAAPAVRQFAVTAPGTPSPYPASPVFDVIRVPQAPKLARARGGVPRYRVTIAGTQTSSWSYDRSTQEGACSMIARGSGRQTLTVRSTGKTLVEEIRTADGALALRTVGERWLLAHVPATIAAVRDSSEEKTASGCDGVPSGGDGGGAPQTCTPTGSRSVQLTLSVVSFRDARGITALPSPASFNTPTTAPDCPVELFDTAMDPLDLLVTPPAHGGGLRSGGDPGKVVVVIKGSDVTRVEGGSVRTTLRLTLTFRRVN